METAGNRNQRSRRREEKVWDSASVMAQMASIGIAIKKNETLSPSHYYGVLIGCFLATDITGVLEVNIILLSFV